MTNQNSHIEDTTPGVLLVQGPVYARVPFQPGLSLFMTLCKKCKHFDWNKSKGRKDTVSVVLQPLCENNLMLFNYQIIFSFGYLWPVLWQIRLEFVTSTWMTNFTLYQRWIWQNKTQL